MNWVLCNNSIFENEDWEFNHYRYASDKVKLDTYLFEVKDGYLQKKGGTGILPFNEVEVLDETPPISLRNTRFKKHI